MSIVKTTTSKAIGATANVNTLVTLASLTGITAPGPNKINRTILYIDREFMEVLTIQDATNKIVSVGRGVFATLVVPHATGAQVWAGKEQDMAFFNNALSNGGLGTYSRQTVTFESIGLTTLTTGTQTLIVNQLLGGLIAQAPGGAATDTLPTGADLIAGIRSFGEPYIGMSFVFTIKNTDGGANTITVAAGTGGTTKGTMTVAQNNQKAFRIVITSLDLLTYDVYSLGTVTF